MAVVIPLDVVDGAGIQNLRNLRNNVIAYGRVGKVEHQLVAPHGGCLARRLQRPVWVRAVQAAVRVYHFRLEPQAEHHAHAMDAAREFRKPPG